MTIRRAVAADALGLARLRSEAIASTGAWYEEGQRQAWERLCLVDDLICAQTDGTRTIWLAEQAETVLGFVSFGWDAVTGLYVAPGRTGRGIGSALLTTGMGRFPGRTWRVMATRNAGSFYARHGFVGYADQSVCLVATGHETVSFPAVAMFRSPDSSLRFSDPPFPGGRMEGQPRPRFPSGGFPCFEARTASPG